MSEMQGTATQAYEGGTLIDAGPAGPIMVPPSYKWTDEVLATTSDTLRSEKPDPGPHPWDWAPGSYIGTGPSGSMFLPS
ncbi:hypothetical protein [Streptomyces zaomyceticus]|uniref:hypothetical protein n=1 Tax=Streptomyces zaomyceticus TaxID=68286 RepID=UPI00367A1846